MDESLDTCDLLCLDLPNAESIRAALPGVSDVESGAWAARALADPTRLTIAAALRGGDELCVCDMAWVVGQAQNLVSHHLRQLKVAGMVSSRRQGRLVMYRLTERGRALVAVVFGDRALVSDVSGKETDRV
ncbi:ArsR/SmtB family transcription factor [Mycobacteroides chelonae]|uniref:ArsR/SmtB family transcription factor n=1 Tax=Mycobacteroides chelonae TaxID=1774 RepID=UPI001C2CB494|nr:metalloregulator ArsR/SmtB family transcription factor [Mycobacteroides chelonae]MBV0917957.1 metalloregulator ArsR/SmtB family transcription factor [Mycobacteroides chelonae]MEC4903376.1 metalloregulator ArsR/SmtB family transcription factor [Mycobacteroides chelonae]